MKRLIGVELKRFIARDAVRLLGFVIVLSLVLSGVGMFVASDRLPALLAADFDKRAITQPSKQLSKEYMDSCLDYQSYAGSQGFEGPRGYEFPRRTKGYCLRRGFGAFGLGAASSFSSFRIEDPRFHLARIFEFLVISAFPLAILAALVGATFIGAEWSSGSIMTLLTFEPRRWRVLGAKLAVCLGVVVVGTMLVHIFMMISFLPATFFRGTTAGLSLEWLKLAAPLTLRSALAAAVLATIGFAAADLSRHTVAALGGITGYLVIGEGFLREYWKSGSKYLLGNNILAFVESSVGTKETLSTTGAGIELTMLAALALGAVFVMGRLRSAA